MIFTSVLLLIILVMNIILYIMTWLKIKKESDQVKRSLGTMSARMRATHRAAKAMSLFVLAFFIQWWAMALFGAWQLATTKEVPQAIHHLVTTFSNIGGCLNLAVFFIIHRKRLSMGERDATENAITSLSTRRSAETSSDPTAGGESVGITSTGSTSSP